MKKKESEFGKGLTYCIGLFLAHAERYEDYKKNNRFDNNAEMWFNGASDHLYEIDTNCLPKGKLRKDIEDWRDKVIHFGHGFSKPYPKEKDVFWSVEKAKEFLFLIDKKLLKLKPIKGSWE